VPSGIAPGARWPGGGSIAFPAALSASRDR
jgi:hypothetical protein